MRSPDFRSELRGAVYRGDGPVVVELVHDKLLPEDALQSIGDGLLVAFALQTMARLVQRCSPEHGSAAGPMSSLGRWLVDLPCRSRETTTAPTHIGSGLLP